MRMSRMPTRSRGLQCFIDMTAAFILAVGSLVTNIHGISAALAHAGTVTPAVAIGSVQAAQLNALALAPTPVRSHITAGPLALADAVRLCRNADGILTVNGWPDAEAIPHFAASPVGTVAPAVPSLAAATPTILGGSRRRLS